MSYQPLAFAVTRNLTTKIVRSLGYRLTMPLIWTAIELENKSLVLAVLVR